MAKSKRLITVTAGRLVYGVCYTQATITDTAAERRQKNQCSSAARKKLNHTASYKKLQGLLCCNFTRDDLYITLGFDNDHLPENRKKAKAIMSKFIDRLRARRRAQNLELKYVYSIHELQDDGTRRLHFHLVINATPGKNDYELVRSLWDWGTNIEIMKIGSWELYRKDDFLELAQYLVRERNPESGVNAARDKGYVPSRNLAKPIRSSELVDENITITAPPGAEVLDREEKQNGYGCYTYISYLLPPPRKKAEPKRRVKKE